MRIRKQLTNKNIFFLDGTIILHGHEFVPLFDYPHLFKCLRNNLLDKDLEIAKGKFASWDHLKALYDIDWARGANRKLQLTPNHIENVDKVKMRVKYATQVFSSSVANEMQLLAEREGKVVVEKIVFLIIECDLFIVNFESRSSASYHAERSCPDA